MTKNRILLLFLTAGLILAVVLGVYFYQTNQSYSAAEVTALLENYFEKIRSGDLAGARELMTPDTAQLLREPGTALGERIYRDLSLTSVDNVNAGSGGMFTADVILTLPDTLSITAKAGLLFAERVTEEGPADDADAVMASIYDEILARDDLPMTEAFCIVRLTDKEGRLLIAGDEKLQQTIEGSALLFTGSK